MDTSSRGMAGVFSVCRKGQELLATFYSKKLSPAETEYSATEFVNASPSSGQTAHGSVPDQSSIHHRERPQSPDHLQFIKIPKSRHTRWVPTTHLYHQVQIRNRTQMPTVSPDKLRRWRRTSALKRRGVMSEFQF